MKYLKVLAVPAVVLVAVLAIYLVPALVRPVSVRPSVSPMIVVGPQAVPAEVASPAYGLFSCQVGLSAAHCYDPYEMRVAYKIDTLISQGYDGRGKTIVIIDAFQHPTLPAQLAFFNSFYGLPAFNAGAGNPTFTQVAPDGLTTFDPTSQNQLGWAEEISLDVEWAHAIAPGANIVLELAHTNYDVDLISALNDAINNNRGDVISMSFGGNDSCLGPELTAAWHQAFVNATRKGITLFASTGDNGAGQGACDSDSLVQAVSSPASDPLVVGVAGTELHAADYCFASLGCDPATHPAAGTYQSEVVWNEPGGGAGGGGFSPVWDEPAYQQGTIHGGKRRGVGDVAYSAAVGHGVLTRLMIPGVQTGWYLFGGTSAGAPQWAALTVILDQYAGRNYGFVNAALYKIGQNAGPYANSFNDVTSGNNSAFGVTGYNAGPGWDAATGLGSPQVSNLVNELPLFWSGGQGSAAIAGSAPHARGKTGAHGQVTPH